MAKLRTSIQGRDSLKKHVVIDRLHQIIDRALAQTPDAAGLLLSSGADDHRYVPGRLVPGAGVRRFGSVAAGLAHAHQTVFRLVPRGGGLSVRESRGGWVETACRGGAARPGLVAVGAQPAGSTASGREPGENGCKAVASSVTARAAPMSQSRGEAGGLRSMSRGR